MRAGENVSFNDISATTAAFVLRGGKYGVDAVASWGGGSVTLEKMLGDGATFAPVVVTPAGQLAAIGADFDALASTGADSLTALLNGQTYNATTKQLSGTPGASVTLTTAQQEGLIALANTLGAAVESVPVEFTDNGFLTVNLPPGTYKFTVTTATGVYVAVQCIPGD